MEKYKLIKFESISVPEAEIYTYEHIKTGAKIVHIDCDDKERAFAIQFRTLPYSDNGICHILEHSVLSGSRKYNVKEPFVELLKGSMNTFLNAMTYPDKTVYPFSTTNEKEFLNLMDVYLDAVLFPNIYKDEDIMAQEGWHYEISESGELSINGVVYNEMKGVFSQPDQVIFNKLQSTLYDNVYRHESGGKPEAIPELTQKEFVDFHKKYYHPSNSTIALYGDMNIEKVLDKIDEYFCEFEKGEVAEEVKPTESFTEMKKEYVPYPVMKKMESQCIAGLGIVQGSYKNLEENLGLKILTDALFMQESSPVKNMLLDSGLVHDLYAMFDDSFVQPLSVIVIRGMEEDNADTVLESMGYEFERLASEGIDRDLLKASLNQWKFSIKEGFENEGMPKGIVFGIEAIANMDRGISPAEKMDYDSFISSIEDKIESGYMEELLNKYYVNNNHRAAIIMTPDEKMMDRDKKKFASEMEVKKSEMSEKDIESIKNRMASLLKRQTTPDRIEDIKSIPKLNVEDVDREIERVYLSKSYDEGNVEIYEINKNYEGISYLVLNLRMDNISEEDISAVSLISALMGFAGTANSDYMSLNREMLLYTGGISIEPVVYEKDKNAHIYLQLSVKFLDENIEKAMALAEDILMNTNVDEISRIDNILNILKSDFEMEVIERGNSIAGERLMSYFSPKSYFGQKISGIDFYDYILNAREKFNNDSDSYIEELKKVYEKILKTGKIIAVYNGKEIKKVKENIVEMTEIIVDKSGNREKITPALGAKNEAILIPAEVNYVAKGYNYKDFGFKYSGSMVVANRIINTDYLWEKVRVLGGAYGCGAEIRIGGSIYASSFRDPNVNSTIQAYDGISEYLSNLDISKEDMDRYIVGTMSVFSRPLTGKSSMQIALGSIFEGIDNEFRKKTVEEILDTKLDDVKSMSEIFKKVMEKDNYVAIGSSRIKDEAGDKFNIRSL